MGEAYTESLDRSRFRRLQQADEIMAMVAAGILYPAFGILLSPILASAAMAFSSVSVVTNGLRLRHVRVA